MRSAVNVSADPLMSFKVTQSVAVDSVVALLPWIVTVADPKAPVTFTVL
ncbi:MAG: hypothetical protein ACREV1_06410 [Gammaproteobacteria bacterium]